MPTIVSPLAGAPYTKETRDASNKSTFNITCEVLTPERAMVVDWLLQAVALVLVVAVIVTCNDTGWKFEMTLQLSLTAGLVYFVVGCFLRDVLRKQTFIKMNADHVFTYPYYITKKVYDRKSEHTFTVIQHKALDESRRHEKAVAEASMRGRLLRKKPYYQDSWHVVYVNGHTRIDLCTAYGAKDASAILNRLMFCDRVLNQQLGIGGGFSRDADDQFGDDAGDL